MSERVGVLVPALLLAAGTVSGQQPCQLVQVEGRTLHACATGNGPTTIALAAGAGQASGTWSRLVPELAEAARLITFDRPGLGRSEAGVSPRSPTRIARELHSVLEAFGVEEPVLLVGHSMGGVHVLRYAALFPERVAAVVVLDAPPPGFEEERRELLSPAEVAERERLLESGLTNAPEAVRLEREGARGPREWDFSAFPRGVPLLVVVADSQDFGDLGSATAHRRLWMAKSREWLNLSDRAEFIVAEGSGHMIHHDRVDLVAAVIRRLLDTDAGATGRGITSGSR